MTSSRKIDNSQKDISILAKSLTQGLGEHSLSADKMYSISFTKVNTKFCQVYIIIEQTVTYLLMV